MLPSYDNDGPLDALAQNTREIKRIPSLARKQERGQMADEHAIHSREQPRVEQQHEKSGKSRQQFVMVIDDSLTTRKILETCLRRAGYQVVSFVNGLTALRWLSTPGVYPPDLVFLDSEVPGMDGYAVAHYLKVRVQYCHIVIIMLSGRGGILDRLKARLAGAEHYLTRPFRTQAILGIVQAHLGMGSLTNEGPLEESHDLRLLSPSSDEQSLPGRKQVYG